MSQLQSGNPNVVVIQEVVKKPPANPLLRSGNASKTPAPSLRSTSSLTSASQAVLANRILFNDQRCFLTGEVSTELQACHLMNAIRSKQKPAKIQLKAQIEFILTRQGFNGGKDFFLDSLVNCLALDVHWHGHLNKRGSFCIAVPIPQIEALVHSLALSNYDWEVRAEKDPTAKRDLDTTIYPFVVQTYVVLILRPPLFLPDNKPLMINMERTLRTRGANTPQVSAPESWVAHRLRPGSPFLFDDAGHPFDSLPFKSERTLDDSLSIFSLLVNAYYKLQSLPRDTLAQRPKELSDYATRIRSLFRLIFFTPDGLNNPGPYPPVSEVPPVPTSAPGPADMFDEWGADSDSDSDSDSESDSEIASRLDALGDAFDVTLSDERRDAALMRGLGMSPPVYEPLSPLLAP